MNEVGVVFHDQGWPAISPGIESPYDPEARYRSKSGMHWTGYVAVLTETCDEDLPHLITHVATTTAAVHEVNCTAPVQRGAGRAGPAAGRAPGRRRLRGPPSCWSAAGRSTASG